jgi:hypothetical protein
MIMAALKYDVLRKVFIRLVLFIVSSWVRSRLLMIHSVHSFLEYAAYLFLV